MAIRTRNSDTHFRPHRGSAASMAILCLWTFILWGCAKPSETKDKPAADTPPATQDPGSNNDLVITFSSGGVTDTAFDIVEGNRTPISVTLNFSKALTTALTLNYSIQASGTAKQETADISYTSEPDQRVGNGVPVWKNIIPVGTLSWTVTPAVISDDLVYEGDETVDVGLSIPGSGSRTVEFTIKDNDKPPSVFLEFKDHIFTDATHTGKDQAKLKETEGAVTIHATLVGSESSPFPIRIPLTFAGSAAINQDYRNPGRFTPDANSTRPDGCPLVYGDAVNPSVLVIPPNTKEIDFAVLLNDDFATEPEETAVITAHTPSILGPTIECGGLVSADLKPLSSKDLTLIIDDDEANGSLNPTGVTKCASDLLTADNCPAADYPNQDGDTGSSTSYLAPEPGTPCLIDSNTKLEWEAKTKPTSTTPLSEFQLRHHVDYAYTWLDKRANINGGDEGNVGGENSCEKNLSACNTDAYIKKINDEAYCGHTDWRLPSVKELLTLVRHGVPTDASAARIDGQFLPNTRNGPYWTSTPVALYSSFAWVVDFSDGRVYDASKGESTSQSYFIRLVRNANP